MARVCGCGSGDAAAELKKEGHVEVAEADTTGDAWAGVGRREKGESRGSWSWTMD